MTNISKDRQKIIDGFHEKVISLIYKRRLAMKYGRNGQEEYDRITAEIMKIDDERRAYERNSQPQRQKKSEIEGAIPEATTGRSAEPAKTEI